MNHSIVRTTELIHSSGSMEAAQNLRNLSTTDENKVRRLANRIELTFAPGKKGGENKKTVRACRSRHSAIIRQAPEESVPTI